MPEISPACCTFADLSKLRFDGILRGETLLRAIQAVAINGPTEYSRNTAKEMLTYNPTGVADFAEWFDYVEPPEETACITITIKAPKSDIERCICRDDVLDLVVEMVEGDLNGEMKWEVSDNAHESND